MKFAQEIKQALKKAGLAEGLAEKIEVTSVDEIEAAVKKLASDTKSTQDLSGDEFLAALKEAGLDKAYEKNLQSETDRRVTAAVKTNTEKLQTASEAHAKKEAEEREAKEKGTTLSDEQKEIQELKSTVGELKDLISGISTTLSTGDLTTKVKAELTAQGLSESFVGNITVSDPDQIKAAVTAFKTTVDAQTQSSIDVKLEAGELAPVKAGESGKTLQETAVADFAKGLSENGTPANAEFQGVLSAETAAEE